ncbi:hypothetical protein D3C71_1850660 [compost metagenome]
MVDELNVAFVRIENSRVSCKTSAASAVGCTLLQCERGICPLSSLTPKKPVYPVISRKRPFNRGYVSSPSPNSL